VRGALVFVPANLSNIELFWELPPFARFFGRLSAFSRLILFDRRGSGMSDGVAGTTPLEEQVDDVRMVIDAVGAEQPVLVSFLEGCCLIALSAASHPDLARALVPA
jgi:pimeloyl-ACP methyl ester carboxylesterase